jgi:endonuclease-8
MLGPGGEAAHPRLRALGPDVLASTFTPAPAVAGLRARPAVEIADALLDQTALSGIGNVYKSETLFLCGVDPFAPVAALEESVLDRLVRTAERLMKRNLERAGRRTTPLATGPRLWVYERAGRPCRRCGAPILMRRQGHWGRLTYWCPRCQPRLTIPEIPLEVESHAPSARRRPDTVRRPGAREPGRPGRARRSGRAAGPRGDGQR